MELRASQATNFLNYANTVCATERLMEVTWLEFNGIGADADATMQRKFSPAATIRSNLMNAQV